MADPWSGLVAWTRAEIRPSARALPVATDRAARERMRTALGYTTPAGMARDLAAAAPDLVAGGCEAGFDRLARLLLLDPPDSVPQALDGLPAEAEVSPRARLVQARLWLLGFRTRPAGTPFGEDDRLALLHLAHVALGPAGGSDVPARIAAALALSADATRLTDALLARDPSGFLVTRRPADMAPAALRGPVRCDPEGFLVPAASFFGQIFWHRGSADLAPSRFETEHDGDAPRAAADTANLLGLRLLQLRLQQAGFYDGLVDGMFGPRSWAALEEATRDVPELFPELHAVLPDGAHVAVSLRRVALRLFPLLAPPGAEAAFEAALDVHGEEIAARAEELQAASRAQPAPRPPSVGVFVFRSLGRVMRGALRAVGAGLAFIGRLVERLFRPIADLLDWLRHLGARLLAVMRRAGSAARRFLLCRPMGGSGVVSRLAPDRDAVFYVAPGTTPDAVDAHHAAFRRDLELLPMAGALAGAVLGVARAAATGPVGWVMLVLRVWRETELLRAAPEAARAG